MLIDVNFYKASLKRLWTDVFGDDGEYVGLMFECGYSPAECFAEFADGEPVSVLYLLSGRIRNCSAELEGRYLYAAATAREHRNKGLMGKLIREAQEYVRERGLSFISLVPADEGLYDYYSRFDFRAVMYNYRAVSNNTGLRDRGVSITLEEYFTLRKNISAPVFDFSDKECQYAASCLEYADYEFISNTADSAYIISADGTEVLEYITSAEAFSENTEIFLSRLAEGTKIDSPYDLSGFCECRKRRFGMVFFTDSEPHVINDDGIYMNIALD